MAGLIKENFVFEVMTELSWIKRVLAEVCENLEIDTYESTLLKYHVETEEEGQMMNYRANFLHSPYEEIRALMAKGFEKAYGKPFGIRTEVLEKLIKRFLHRLHYGGTIPYKEDELV